MKTETLRLARALAVVGLILAIAGLYWYGAVQQLQRVNTDMASLDQAAYMDYARNLHESGYTFVGGRNRMPVYPFLQSLFYRPGMADQAFFARGKYVNLVLSLALLAGLAVLFRRHFSWFTSLNLLLVGAFTVFVFKAGWFQAELLHYFLSFCLFLLMWRLLGQMSWQLAILTGIVAGLAHLTKASILPGFILFFMLATVKWGRVTLRRWQASARALPAWPALSPLLGLLLVAVFFLITIFPYIRTSKRVFGHYFYNVNSTFYIWYDSWEEVERGTRAHGDRLGWPDMPPEDIPSLSRYLRQHTWPQVAGRFVAGGLALLGLMARSYGYFKYVLLYLGLLICALLWFRQRAKHTVVTHPFLSLFLVLYFAGYLLLYAWYIPIAPGNRFVLALFLPGIFTMAYGLHALLSSSRLKIRGHSVEPLVVANLAILLVLLPDIYLVLTERVGSMVGGL